MDVRNVWIIFIFEIFYWKVFLYFCICFVRKIEQLVLEKLHNSGMVHRRKPPDPSLNRNSNALSIGVQYTLSYQWPKFDLKCLIWAFCKKPHLKSSFRSNVTSISLLSDCVISEQPLHSVYEIAAYGILQSLWSAMK